MYFVGRGPVTLRGRWMAAVLACGPAAALSHRAAAALIGLRADNRARTDVSLPSQSVRQRTGIEVHAANSLTGEDLTRIHGLPVVLAIDKAQLLRTFDHNELQEALARSNGRSGAAVVRSILEEYHGPADRHERFAANFLALCERAGLPDPEPEACIDLEDGPIHVDFLWPHERIAVELDSRAFHDSARGFDEDRDRDQQLLLAGYLPVRVSWRQVHGESSRTEKRLKRLHEMRAAAPSS